MRRYRDRSPKGSGLTLSSQKPPVNEPRRTLRKRRRVERPTTDARCSDDFPPCRFPCRRDSRLVSLAENESLGAEKFRFLAVRLRQIQQARQLKKILITSTIPEEGKSMVSANLAVTLARRKQHKVLLLDGDLRRPVLAREFGLAHLAGLSECLQGRTAGRSPTFTIWKGRAYGFCRPVQPPENPLELMQSGRLVELLDQLTAWFDWIIIDSPPILPLADTSVWARIADGILLVAREGTTQKRQLKRGLEALTANRSCWEWC